MKPSYDRITAVCDRDGVFTVDRKPKKGATTTDGRPNDRWTNVVCPKCRMWAPVQQVEHVQSNGRDNA